MSQRIDVIFDKSHITTLGKKMYAKSIDLIRELVNNSYDADASKVNILLTKSKIEVEDNGSGMDLSGLRQYFTIGSQEKVINSISSKYKRKRIGELGIGKFASLGVASKFEVITQRADFAASVVFDQHEWDNYQSDWSVPCKVSNIPLLDHEGTKISLYDIKQDFSPQEVANRLRVSVPIDSPNFAVSINDELIEPIFIEGRRFKIEITTIYGIILGQLVLANKPLSSKAMGVECCVKNVMISKSLFGYEHYGHGINLISGKVNADFLPFTASRNNFIESSEEYKLFFKQMREKVKDVINIIQNRQKDKDIQQSFEALKKASNLLRKAFKNAPDLFPKSKVHVTDGHSDVKQDDESVISSPIKSETKSNKGLRRRAKTDKRGERSQAHINPLFEHKVIKKLRTDFGFAFAFTEDDENGPPSYFANDTIFINREHKLYKFYSKDVEAEVSHLVRLISSEAIFLTNPADMRQAYEKQIEMLSAIYLKMK